MYRSLVLAAALLILCPVSGASSQPLRIGLTVTEDTNGIFQSEFAAAFRRLGDVEVVTSEGENPNFILRVVAMCEPDKDRCDAASTYSVAFTFSQPISYSFATTVLDVADTSVVHNEEAKQNFWNFVKDYEIFHTMWTASWGRSAYRNAVAETVAEIDSKCLEKSRLFRRWGEALRESDNSRAETIMNSIRNNRWIC